MERETKSGLEREKNTHTYTNSLTHLIKRVGNEHLKFFVAYQRVPLCGNINDLIVQSVGAKTAF